MKEELKQIAKKIVSLTGYGQALHINDILPELEEAYKLGVADGEKYEKTSSGIRESKLH